MNTEYKISSITKDKDVKVFVRFYEGDFIDTKQEMLDGTKIPIKNFIRSKKIKEQEFVFPVSFSHADIRNALNKELLKIKSGIPIDEQKNETI